MIKVIQTSLPGATPNVYSIEIEEDIRGGFRIDNMPDVSIVATASGNPIAYGTNTMQRFLLTITIAYLPRKSSSTLKTKSFGEFVDVAVVGVKTIFTPATGTPSVTAKNTYCNGTRANTLKMLTSLSVSY